MAGPPPRQISHIISHGHFSRPPENVAIPTMQIQHLNKLPGNYVRNCYGEGRCTRYGAQHPLWGATPDQKGCTAYGSGAVPPVTRTNAEAARRGPGCGTGRWRRGLAAVPVGGGGAWPRRPWVARGLAAVPVGGGGAWLQCPWPVEGPKSDGKTTARQISHAIR